MIVNHARTVVSVEMSLMATAVYVSKVTLETIVNVRPIYLQLSLSSLKRKTLCFAKNKYIMCLYAFQDHGSSFFKTTLLAQ